MKFFVKDKEAYGFMLKHAVMQKGKIVFLCVISILISVLSLFRARFYQLLIDFVTPGSDFGADFKRTALYFALAVGVTVVLYQLYRYVKEAAVTDMYNQIRLSAIASAMSSDYKKLLSYHTGDILTRVFSDAKVISENTVDITPSALELIITLFGSAAYLYYISKPFCVILVVFGIIMMLAATVFRKTLKRLHKSVQSSDGEVRSLYQEQLSGMLMIKVFKAEKRALSEADEKQLRYRSNVMKRQAASCIVNFAYLIGCNAVLILTFFYAVFGIKEGFLTYGSLTAMMQLANNIQGSVTGLGGILPRLYSSAASAERICEICSLEPEKEESSKLCKIEKIEFNNVSFSYKEEDIFKNISFSLSKGETVALQGPSGIGKSTLLLLLLGIYEPKTGEILIKNNSESEKAGRGTRKFFSYTPQGNGLFSGTIAENITLSKPDATKDEIINALKLSCAYEFVNELPEGIDTYLGENGVGLSEGQQQRISIARAIISEASVLLFDEATSALDEETEKKLIANLQSVGRTAIFVTHRKSPLSICSSAYEVSEDGIKKVK